MSWFECVHAYVRVCEWVGEDVRAQNNARANETQKADRFHPEKHTVHMHTQEHTLINCAQKKKDFSCVQLVKSYKQQIF